MDIPAPVGSCLTNVVFKESKVVLITVAKSASLFGSDSRLSDSLMEMLFSEHSSSFFSGITSLLLSGSVTTLTLKRDIFRSFATSIEDG